MQDVLTMESLQVKNAMKIMKTSLEEEEEPEIHFQASSTNINNLPNEILLNIFSNIDIMDLAKQVQYVCRRWFDICSFDIFWKGSEIKYNRQEDLNETLQKLKHMRYVQSLDLEIDENQGKIFRAAAMSCRGVRKLRIWSKPYPELLIPLISNCCQKLEGLTIPTEDLCFDEVVDCVGELELPDIGRMQVLRNYDLDIKLQWVSDCCPKLQHLDIAYHSWRFVDVKYLLKRKRDMLLSLAMGVRTSDDYSVLPLVARYCRGLEYLFLGGTGDVDWQPVDGGKLVQVVRLPRLSVLRLGCSRLLRPEDVLSAFNCGDQITSLQHFAIVDPSHSDINDAVVQAICSSCPNLTELTLHNCYNLTDDAFKFLYKCPNLKFLDLQLNNPDYRYRMMGDASMEHIAKCQHLERLNMVGMLTSLSLAHLIQMTELKTLKLYNFGHFHLSKKMIKASHKTLEKVKVFQYPRSSEQEGH